MKKIICAALLLVLVACASPEPKGTGDGTWVGTITTEGNVTTVVNESGSVWGGPARLVEEASIGVNLGAAAYMLGNVEGVAVTADRIFVLDRSVPVLRAYDLAGKHLLDMGRAGQGPGEFTNPYLLAASEDDRLFVRTNQGLVIFDTNGNHLLTLNEPGGIVLPMVAGVDALYLPVSGAAGSGHLPIAPDGKRGEFIARPSLVEWQPWALTAGRMGVRYMELSVPFSPSTVSTLAPSGAVIQARSDEYRIDVRRPDASVLQIVRRVDAVPVAAEERAWHEAMAELRLRSAQPDWEWNANPIPATKPYFSHFYTDPEGVLWVRRVVRTEEVSDCDADPRVAFVEQRAARSCFRDIIGFDVFDTDGRYMGAAEMPSVRLVDVPSIRGDTVVQAIEDEAGTIMVKRYRLVLPGEEGQ